MLHLQVNIALLAIGVDYAQVLSMFAATQIAWPPFISVRVQQHMQALRHLDVVCQRELLHTRLQLLSFCSKSSPSCQHSISTWT